MEAQFNDADVFLSALDKVPIQYVFQRHDTADCTYIFYVIMVVGRDGHLKQSHA